MSKHKADPPPVPENVAVSRQLRRKQERDNELLVCSEAIKQLLIDHGAAFAVTAVITYPDGRPHHTHQVSIVDAQ